MNYAEQFRLGAVQDNKAFPDHRRFLKQVISWGFLWVEFKYERALDPDNQLLGPLGAELGRMASRAGLGVSVHAPYDEKEPINLGDEDRTVRVNSRRAVRQSLEFAANVGASYVTIHGSYQWFPDADASFQLPLRLRVSQLQYETMRERYLEELSALCWQAKAAGLTMAVENFYDSPLGRGKVKFPVRPDQVRHCLDAIPDNLGFMYDLGHGNSLGMHPADFLDMVGPRHLMGTHIHDNDGSKDQHWVVGEGTIDMLGFLLFAKQRQLTFPLNLELKNEDDLLASRGALQTLLQKIADS